MWQRRTHTCRGEGLLRTRAPRGHGRLQCWGFLFALMNKCMPTRKVLQPVLPREECAAVADTYLHQKICLASFFILIPLFWSLRGAWIICSEVDGGKIHKPFKLPSGSALSVGVHTQTTPRALMYRGLWSSHGSPLIPFDREMTFIVGHSQMTSPWQLLDKAKRSDNPSTPLSHPYSCSACFVCATSFSKERVRLF